MRGQRADSFAVQLTHRVRGAVVIARGEIDMPSAGELRCVFDAAIGTGRAVEVDLAETTFMDSTGVAVLFVAQQRLRAAGDTIVVCDPSPTVERVLDMTGLAGLVEARRSAR